MSTISRSESSSPDILGPPGDAEYLISSPIKPFVGRQSFLSPANSTRLRTPAKRSRVSLSPAKSAHSIRFDDVVLPGSPTMKLDGRQRSLSPEKFPTDGNVSPWRIRVTLEATQDEENELQGSPARKKLRPATVTTKVPLKDDRSPLQEKAPARRRGRPRKSDVQALNGSPWPGSPGNTPGPKEETPQKRKRGRPRKGTPKPKAQEVPAVEDEPTPTPAPAPAPAPAPTETDLHFSPMDTTADAGGDSGRQWSPMNFTADGLDSDSLGADDLPIANLRAPTPAANQEYWNHTHTNNHDFGTNSYETPVIGQTEHHFLDNDENINSTPSKMPSPTRGIISSSTRSAHHAESNSPPHTYPPTPTSSHGEESPEVEDRTDNRLETDVQNVRLESTADPTNEHEEFDSIMESEGFTMISLDTLPSVKQRALGSSAKIGSQNSVTRDNKRVGERLRRQLPGGFGELRSDSQSSAKPSPVAGGSSQRPTDFAENEHVSTRTSRQDLIDAFSYPELPVTSPQKTQTSFDTEPAPLYPALANEEQVHEEDVVEIIDAPVDVQEEDIEETEDDVLDEEEDEMEVVDPSPRTERRDLAPISAISPRLQREHLWQMERQAVSRQAQDPKNEPRVIYIESDENASRASVGNTDAPDDIAESGDESDVYDHELADEQAVEDEAGEEPIEEESADEDPNSEPVERHRAPESRVEASQSPFDYAQAQSTIGVEQPPSETYDDDGSVEIWQQDTREEQFIPRELSTIDESAEVDQEVLDEDDAFDDIWQQEARDHSRLSERSDDHVPTRVEAAASAWRQIADNSADQSNLGSSPAYVTMEHNDENGHGPTYVRKLRDEEVDLSALLAEEDTPNRARYYNGTSTPRSMLSRQSGTQYSSINGSAVKSGSSRKTGLPARLQPISQSSPEMEPEVEHESPATSHEHPRVESSFEDDEEEGTGSVRDVEAHEDSVATPEQKGQSEEQAPPSTWFQRITSLTPRWLKAPAKTHDSSSEDGELNDQDGDASIQSAKEVRESLEHVPSPKRTSESPRYFDELAGLPRYDRDERASSHEEEEDEEEASEVENADEQELDEQSLSESHIMDDNDAVVDLPEDEHDKLAEPRPLAAFGYFSDDHYKALRRIYRMAKQYPEQFPYYDSPGRAKIIGDWIWTSDGHHGVPITEIQFAIIDRFVHGLSRADVKYGGSGRVEWTEADLHRRLISIIIGEQIREERKFKAARGASVDTWR